MNQKASLLLLLVAGVVQAGPGLSPPPLPPKPPALADLKPDLFHWSLTVLDSPRPAVFTSGAGHVYLTTKLLDSLAPDTERGRAVLTFLLARELGHIGLGHVRRGYQLQQLQAEREQA